MVSRPSHLRCEPHDLTGGELAGRVYQLARCAGSRVDPDDWFPVARDVAKARDEAARAIAVCARCPVRPDCLELSMRHASGVGAHGVWGGLVEEERRAVRRRWLAGTSVTEFLQDRPPHGYGETTSPLTLTSGTTRNPALTGVRSRYPPSEAVIDLRLPGQCRPAAIGT